jgi:hypothetical protein
MEGELSQENAVTALRSHIIASDGTEHGPQHELPADLDPSVLSEYVVGVETNWSLQD